MRAIGPACHMAHSRTRIPSSGFAIPLALNESLGRIISRTSAKNKVISERQPAPERLEFRELEEGEQPVPTTQFSPLPTSGSWDCPASPNAGNSNLRSGTIIGGSSQKRGQICSYSNPAEEAHL